MLSFDKIVESTNNKLENCFIKNFNKAIKKIYNNEYKKN